MTGRLDGRVVVVTGAAQGIGRAYALRAAEEGATVVVTDFNADAGKQVAAEIRDLGGKAEFERLDVADPDSCSAVAASLGERFPSVHGLINNAAIFSTIEMKPFWEIDIAEWDRIMAVNLRGPWSVTTAFLPLLRSAKGASIVNISSDSVWLGRSGYLHYVSGKAGIAGMTYAMAHELGGFEIRVNAVSPGPTYTEVARATVSDAQKEQMRSAQALHRDAHPGDLVGVVLFLLSEESGWVTGQNIHVNGGLVHV